MLTVLGYVWAVFGAYWIIFAPAISTVSFRQSTSKKLQFAFLGITFAVLLWRADVLSPVWIMIGALGWTMLALRWVTPRTEALSGEYRLYRLLRILVGGVTFTLLFWKKTAIGVLGERMFPPSFSIVFAGFSIALLGLALAGWARTHLGRYWSDKIAIQAEHNLVQTGPYAFIRHPIYSGVLLGIAGSALVVGEWRALVAFAIMSTNYAVKATKEDKLLAERFGEDFRTYQQGTGMLFPNLINSGRGR